MEDSWEILYDSSIYTIDDIFSNSWEYLSSLKDIEG